MVNLKNYHFNNQVIWKFIKIQFEYMKILRLQSSSKFLNVLENLVSLIKPRSKVFLIFGLGNPRRFGPVSGPVQGAIRWQTQRKATLAERPDHHRGPQRRPHRPNVRLLPGGNQDRNQDHQGLLQTDAGGKHHQVNMHLKLFKIRVFINPCHSQILAYRVQKFRF